MVHAKHIADAGPVVGAVRVFRLAFAAAGERPFLVRTQSFSRARAGLGGDFAADVSLRQDAPHRHRLGAKIVGPLDVGQRRQGHVACGLGPGDEPLFLPSVEHAHGHVRLGRIVRRQAFSRRVIDERVLESIDAEAPRNVDHLLWAPQGSAGLDDDRFGVGAGFFDVFRRVGELALVARPIGRRRVLSPPRGIDDSLARTAPIAAARSDVECRCGQRDREERSSSPHRRPFSRPGDAARARPAETRFSRSGAIAKGPRSRGERLRGSPRRAARNRSPRFARSSAEGSFRSCPGAC